MGGITQLTVTEQVAWPVRTSEGMHQLDNNIMETTTTTSNMATQPGSLTPLGPYQLFPPDNVVELSVGLDLQQGSPTPLGPYQQFPPDNVLELSVGLNLNVAPQVVPPSSPATSDKCYECGSKTTSTLQEQIQKIRHDISTANAANNTLGTKLQSWRNCMAKVVALHRKATAL